VLLGAAGLALGQKVNEAELHSAVTFYASFDDAVEADVGGQRQLGGTRFNHPTEKGKFEFTRDFDGKIFRIARDKGVQGGCLEATEPLPRNGRIFFPARGNIAFQKGGWSGSLSCWINTDPNLLLKTPFCDPIQITQKGAGNGGIWFDFNDAKPRDLRMGMFPAIPEGGKGIPESDPNAPLVRVPKVGFQQGQWHHIVLTWRNFDTGKNDAHAVLYLDGKRIGEIKDRAIAMDWDLDQAGIYTAVNYVGLLDELALFNRALTAEEVAHLHQNPRALVGLKKKAGAGLPDLDRRLVKGAKLPAPPAFPFDRVTAAAYQKACADALGLPVEFTTDLGITFVLVPPGTFRMGSPDDEPGHNSGGYDETLCTVTLTRPFYLAKHETTVGQFRRFVEASGHVTDVEKTGGGNAHDDRAVWKHRPGTQWRKPGYAGPHELTDRHPVVHVSHSDARAFCRWLNQTLASGEPSTAAANNAWTFDLPTEAQWEWACRAGAATRFWWGADEDSSGKVANVGARSLKKVHPDWPRTIMPMDDGHAFSAPVGSYQANAFGLCDMLGNVWEFCSTHYGPYPRQPATDPGHLDVKRGFAVRGGGWSNTAADVRCASRNADPPHFGHSNLGFRVALAIPVR
jgi:formylglycine-generating enzyme required for sulfatase activity